MPPKPGENPKLVPFDTWWNKIVIVDTKRDRFTRKDIILTISNTSGGAHVDPYLDEAYANLTKHNSMGWRYKVGNIEGDFINIELASARQIAQEILYSLQHAEFFS